jgi:hypothetical protein
MPFASGTGHTIRGVLIILVPFSGAISATEPDAYLGSAEAILYFLFGRRPLIL